MDHVIAIQGDLLIKKIKAVPAKAVKRQDRVIVYGEATGHAHRLTDGDVYDYENRILFTVPTGATIIHEDHNPVPLERGDYEVIRQRQKTGKDMVAIVID